MDGKFLSTKEAAKFLGVSKYSLEIWRVQGKGPRFLKMNKIIRYRPEDLDDFVKKSLMVSTSEGVKA